jgi:hypothetical protein
LKILTPYLTYELTEWPLVEMALLLIGRRKISLTKNSFDLLGKDKSSCRLPAQEASASDSGLTKKNLKADCYKCK